MIFFLSPRSSFFRLSIIIIIISQNHHLDLHTHTDGAVHVQSDSTRTVSRLQIHQRYFLSLNAGLFILERRYSVVCFRTPPNWPTYRIILNPAGSLSSCMRW
jgi:hypothetical protein